LGSSCCSRSACSATRARSRRRSRQWLARHGNPFATIAQDRDGRVGLDWGVYGVPETFALDAAGMIRHKHIGPLTREAWTTQLLPLVQGGTS
jgi:cytochrome c biogenesis protein CcmG/thiol:disulfide interchange protein DsbE